MFKCLLRGLKVFVLGLYMVQFELKVVGRSGFLGFPDPGNVPWTSGKLFSLSLSLGSDTGDGAARWKVVSGRQRRNATTEGEGVSPLKDGRIE